MRKKLVKWAAPLPQHCHQPWWKTRWLKDNKHWETGAFTTKSKLLYGLPNFLVWFHMRSSLPYNWCWGKVWFAVGRKNEGFMLFVGKIKIPGLVCKTQMRRKEKQCYKNPSKEFKESWQITTSPQSRAEPFSHWIPETLEEKLSKMFVS